MSESLSPKQVHFTLSVLKNRINFNLYYEFWGNHSWTQTDTLNAKKTEEAEDKSNLDFYVYLSEHWEPVIWNQSDCITYRFSIHLKLYLLTSWYHTLTYEVTFPSSWLWVQPCNLIWSKNKAEIATGHSDCWSHLLPFYLLCCCCFYIKNVRANLFDPKSRWETR